MEVEAASLELICAVWAVRHGVAAEELAGGTAIPQPVANVVAGVRRWAVWNGGAACPAEWAAWQPRWTHNTAVALAAWWGSTDGVQFLLSKMRAPERKAAKDRALERCATGGRLAMVQWLVGEGATSVGPALRKSVAHGHLAVAQWLVAEGRADVNTRGQGVYTPLRMSAESGHLAVVRWLVEEAGADVHALGDIAFQESAARGHLHVARWLVEEGGADEHAQDDHVLGWAARNGQFAVLRWLIEERGMNVHAWEESALVESAYEGHLAQMQWLVEVAGADIFAAGERALGASAGGGQVAVMEWLLGPESGREWTASPLRLMLRWRRVHKAAREVLGPAIARLEGLDPLLRRSKRRKE